ncbi:MAG TPA: serine hydrolase [Pyrinomonadaceae bacterium]|nr:serine hydrolase [Pyrinomonadaceae bacterium]
MQTFLTNYQIPGATFAIAKNGKLVYMRAFGTANQAGTELTQPYHMFRIASISKPITSIAIMKLIENGQLSLSDKPFGPGGILNADPYFANANITDPRVYNITIQNLLEHAAGWNRDLPMPQNPLPPYPWGYGNSDPIDFPLYVTQTLGEANPVTRRAMIKFSIQKGLDFAPGTSYTYSNIGYLVLGEVIEQKTGMTYENYVKQNIFAPLGIYDIRLGKNLLADKQEREGEYINPFTTLSAYGTGQFVPSQYGGFSLEAMDAHGGWIATARDLVRLLTAADGFPSRPDILSAATIQTMTTPSATNAGYAKGWQVNSAGTWWHSGGLPGTTSWMVRTDSQFSSQLTWAVILNKRSDASGFANAVSNLGFGNCVNSTTTFPTHDLFDVPTQNASAMNFSNMTSNSMTVNWTNGNGDGRVLIMRAGGVPNKFPLDGTEYAAGADLGGGNYVVYSGSGNNTTVGNLNSNTNYQFRLYEYKKNVNTGNYALYQLANAASGSQNTRSTTSQAIHAPFDFDGDSKTDLSIYRPSVGEWWYLRSSDGGNRVAQFGSSSDKLTPGDFTGDGKTDIAFFRPSNGFWFILRSEDSSFFSFPFGTAGDIPAPSDYDGDGKTDAAVFRPTDSIWFIRRSSDFGTSIVGFGSSEDKPVPADYDGDGKTDIAVYRPSDGSWWYLQSSNAQFKVYRFGESTDKPVQGDYSGDGKADIAVWRPSTGEWFVQRSEDNSFYSVPFGTNGDFPSPGDYDGDGKFDPAVFRPATADWFVNRSTAGILITTFGTGGDHPIPNAFVP